MNVARLTLGQNLQSGFSQPDGFQPRSQVVDLTAQSQRRSGDGTNLLFVDQGVADYQQLLSGVAAGTEVHVLDPAQDAIAQITQTLLGRQGIASLQVLSHGQAGGLQLGDSLVNLSSLSSYAQQIQSWSNALTDDADILLYGCNVAEGELGQAFVNILSRLTGADVAASDDLTGNTQRGGDWTLEYATGAIEASRILGTDALARYQSILGISAGAAGNNYAAGSTTFQANLNLVAGANGVVNTNSNGDEPSPVAIDLGSNTFRFYGQNYTGTNQLYVSVNGALTFGSAPAPYTAYTNDNLGSSSRLSQASISPAWDDWVNSTGAILYQFQDLNNDSTPDQLVIEWDNIQHFSNSSTAPEARATFQVVLQLNTGTQDGNILFNYVDLNIPGTSLDEAGSATVGIKAASTSGITPLLISQNSTASPFVGTGRAILISNNTPILDLNGDQTRAAIGVNYVTGFTPGGGAVSIVDSANLTLLDPDSANLSSATIQISNLLDGADEVLAATTTGTNITATYNSSTGELSLTGADTVANYQQVLRTVTYNNTAANLNNTARVITFSVSDGTNTSPIATSTVGLDIPTIDLNGAASGRDYLTYFPRGFAVSVADSNALTISDPDSANLASATVTLTNLRNGTSEVLNAVTTGTNITASYNTTTGVLTLTGSDTVANYQQVLRSVTYNNTASSPDTRDRLITFVANDGTSDSPIATSTVRYGNPPNTVPSVTLPSGNLSYREGAAPISFAVGATLVDPDPTSYNGGSITVSTTSVGGTTDDVLGISGNTFSVNNGSLIYNNQTIGTVTGGSNGAALVITFTSSTVTPTIAQQVLGAISYSNAFTTSSLTSNPGERTLSIVVNDGVGGISTTATRTISVLPALQTNGSDFNNDGVTDYLWRNGQTGANKIVASRELDSFSTVNLPTKGTNWQVLATDDFDGDGDVDILWRDKTNGNVSVWTMNGTSFVSETNFGRAYGWNFCGVGDFNNDGNADIAWTNRDGITQSWIINKPGNTFSIRGVRLGTLGRGWSVAGMGDMDGDGDSDMVLRHTDGSTRMWNINSTTFSVSTVNLAKRDARLWTVAAIGDVDFDGDADIIWTRKTSVFNTSLNRLVDMKNVYLETYQGGAASSINLIAPVTPNWQIKGLGSYDGEGNRSITWRLDGSSLSSVWLLNSASAYSRSISLPSQSAEWSLQVTNPSAIKKRFRAPVDLR